MPAHISIRESIRWAPDAADEPTTTLVLTSAGKQFVDVRILKNTTERDTTVELEDVLPLDRVDWAFGGTSFTELRSGPDGSEIVHSTWRHWIDSRAADGEDVTDEGDMFPLPDGRTLEKGEMVNPATGRMTQYEERWIDVEPLVLASGMDDETRRRPLCVVLRLDDEHGRGRGMVIRLGQFCQGILTVSGELSLERWKWGREGGWKREVRVGNHFLPCGVLTEKDVTERIKSGGEVRYGDFVWSVEEIGNC